jgi:hypothetical protein
VYGRPMDSWPYYQAVVRTGVRLFVPIPHTWAATREEAHRLARQHIQGEYKLMEFWTTDRAFMATMWPKPKQQELFAPSAFVRRPRPVRVPRGLVARARGSVPPTGPRAAR